MSSPSTAALFKNRNPPPSHPSSRIDLAGFSLPSDPLLRPGSYIATDSGKFSSKGTSQRRAEFATTFEGVQREGGGTAMDKSSGNSAGREKRKAGDQDMSWLPPGWTYVSKVRGSGATAGTVDKYYIHPVSGRKFRSKNEVLTFVETGTIPRFNKKKQSENTDANAKSQSSGVRKQKPAPKEKNPASNFDSTNVPLKVKWLLKDYSLESWDAYIGDSPVTAASKREWLAAFTLLASKDKGRSQ
ncbi:hypothetical protein UlMin_013439 [Ulmus minor]